MISVYVPEEWMDEPDTTARLDALLKTWRDRGWGRDFALVRVYFLAPEGS